MTREPPLGASSSLSAVAARPRGWRGPIIGTAVVGQVWDDGKVVSLSSRQASYDPDSHARCSAVPLFRCSAVPLFGRLRSAGVGW
jgi:hypothetical protein